jgi:hypothetical protein
MVAVGLLASAGCTRATSREAVHPTENATATEHGELASEYHLRTNAGDIGTAKVWSHGAYRADVGGTDQTVIRVGFEIENTSSQPIVFDPQMTRLASVEIDKRELTDIPVSMGQGRYIINPHSEGEVDAYFILPTGVMPQQVDSFNLMWAVNSGGQTFSEFTNFNQDEYYGYYSPDYPFYGPYPYAYDPFYEPLYYDPWYWSYYRPVIVTEQNPGVITGQREPRVREHGQMSKATPQMREMEQQARPPAAPQQQPYRTPEPTMRPNNPPNPPVPEAPRHY